MIYQRRIRLCMVPLLQVHVNTCECVIKCLFVIILKIARLLVCHSGGGGVWWLALNNQETLPCRLLTNSECVVLFRKQCRYILTSSVSVVSRNKGLKSYATLWHPFCCDLVFLPNFIDYPTVPKNILRVVILDMLLRTKRFSKVTLNYTGRCCIFEKKKNETVVNCIESGHW